jgi:hypothetical protein
VGDKVELVDGRDAHEACIAANAVEAWLLRVEDGNVPAGARHRDGGKQPFDVCTEDYRVEAVSWHA